MAAHTVDLRLAQELKDFGAHDIDACFNCGNCTAVCRLSEGISTFPRRLIRYGQLGMRDRLVSSQEMWLCWGCRDCSSTCPRQARPSEYVEAVRRYAVASYDRTTIAGRLYTSGTFTAFLGVALAIVFALLLMSGGGRMENHKFALFAFIPYELIHGLGIAVLAIMGLAALINTVTLLSRVASAASGVVDTSSEGTTAPFLARAAHATREVLAELLSQKRFRSCEVDSSKPLMLRPWFVHYTIMWGFIGLLAATGLDFLFKTPGSFVPLWYPMRLLGTVSGLALTYGLVVTMIRRSRPAPPSEGPTDTTASRLVPSDWLFLWLLLSVTLLGFVVEAAVYWPEGTAWGYAAFLVHVALAMELLILFPFTKFAHALYRPVALWVLKLKQGPRTA
ncbi:MAG: 4Fe-4S dicluster domain-containing protein [Chloroflexota bacterium]